MSAEPDPAARTVPALLAQRVAASPSAIAFQTEGAPGQWAPVTWAEFAARVERMRAGLAGAGLVAGDRLAIIAPVSIEWEVLHHAAMALGVAVAGMDGHDLPDRIAGMVELANISAFAVADPGILKSLKAERWARCKLALALEPLAAQWPHGANPRSWIDVEALGSRRGQAGQAPPAATDTATIVFTSGTTGEPKGIAYRHEQVCLAIDAICDAFPFVGPGSRLLCWLPLSNLFQRIVNLAAMRSGAASFLLADPRRVMDVVSGVAPDVLIGVPRFFEKLHDGICDRIAAQGHLRGWLAQAAWGIGRRASKYRLTRQPVPLWLDLAYRFVDQVVLSRIRSVTGERLRCMITGSAPTPRHLLEDLHALGWLVLEAYGLSENVLPMAMNRIDGFRFGTVGRPLEGNQIEVAEGGAIKVRGAGVFAAYLGEADRPPLFDATGFYVTGDLGQFDSDGYLSVSARSTDLIKTSTGRRVAPAGVEAQLRQVPGVDQAILIGNGRKCLIALCTCADLSSEVPERSRLVQALRDRVSKINPHERPLGIALVDRLFTIERCELTPNLKLRRGMIERRFADLIQEVYELVERDTSSSASNLIVI